MTKRFKGKVCVYCGVRPADTADHVFAREFLPISCRADLPKVPACKQCNDTKARLEHYLATVLPFGGRHADATSNLVAMVPRRLEKNAKLHRQLRSGSSRVLARQESGLYIRTMALPFDGEKLEQLIALIAKGLAWHHWDVILGPDCLVDVYSLTKFGELFFSRFSALRAKSRVSGNIGEAAFSYTGAQGIDNPQVSAWEFSICGGLTLRGGPVTASEEISKAGVLTGPKRIFDAAERKARWLSGRALLPT